MKKKVIEFISSYTVVPILLLLLLINALFIPSFYSPKNLLNILYQNSILGVMAIGMTFLMLTGYRDLSAGTLMGLCVSLTIGLQKYGLAVSILVPLLVGLLIGLLNGFLVHKAGISSFIVTFAAMFGCRGLTYLFTKERSFVGSVEAFQQFGELEIFGISVFIWIFMVLLLVSQFILRKIKHGRDTYAVGGNPETARNAGIKVGKVTIINFVICSGSAALGGVLMAAKLNASAPALGWPDLHMQIITMTVLGGTRLSGGYGSMWFTLGGVLTLGIINNLIDMSGIPAYYNQGIIGLILVLVLVVDYLVKPDKNQIDIMN